VPVFGMPQYVPELVPLFFDAGLADPRGGEYREIELTTGGGQSRPVTTHGWYFPQAFEVCWDGLAHPVVRVGGNADLWQDIADAKADFFRKATIVAPPDAEPVAVALLLRLGEAELARRLFVKLSDASLPRFPSAERDGHQVNKSQWFAMAGVSWLSGAFHEAVEAHAIGDDRLAVDIAGRLLQARLSFESAWKNVSPELPTNAVSQMAFLDPVATLLADSERRLKQSPRRPLDPNAMRSMGASARIATLIERLEDVNERQFSQPGGVPLLDSPICKMLVQEGAEAVEPLLDVVEHDQRLTRSYGFGRSFFPPRSLITVAEAAEAVFRDYYHLRVFRWEDPAQRRAWLIRNKYRSQAERYFDLLSGDSNDEVQWLDAAQGLSGGLGEELGGSVSV